MSQTSSKEHVDGTLQLQITQLDEQIETLKQPTLTGVDRDRATEQCLAELAGFSDQVKNILSRLPAHDQRLYSDAIKALSEKLEQVKASSAPKRKFAFKSRHSKPIPKAAEESSPEVPEYPGHIDPIESHDDGQFAQTKINPLENPTIVGSRSEYVALPPLAPLDEVPQASASIIDVQDCTLDICARSHYKSPLAKLHIFNARQSLILCGHVDGSVLFSESQNCVLLVTSGQMRLYKCRDCVVYLHCTSKPIIELSDGIKFAPLPEIFQRTHSQHQKSNTWDQVEDFNWLHADRNPHWRVIAASDRITNELWHDACNGGNERQTLRNILMASIDRPQNIQTSLIPSE